MFQTANLIEAALWIAIGAAFAARALVRRDRWRWNCAAAAVAFVLFGLSDVVETSTGAWWRPWWLLVWKGGCIIAFVWLYVKWRKRTSTLL